MKNPLIGAVEIYDVGVDSQTALMHEAGGCKALDPWDDALCQEVWDLTLDSWKATLALSPRGREARLNLIWKDFLKKKRAPPAAVVDENTCFVCGSSSIAIGPSGPVCNAHVEGSQK